MAKPQPSTVAQPSDPTEVAKRVAEHYNADVLLYLGGIDDTGFGKVVEAVMEGKERDNVLVIMRTAGGSANAAYQIARLLQKLYREFILYTPSFCKSAGTIVALGAHRLLMDPFSELGPLDVQLLKQNELGARKSGLLTRSAFEGLNEAAFDLYEHFMLSIMRKSGGLVSFRVAAEISASVTGSLMSPVYGKIDPDVVGSDRRDLEVALHYGMHLISESKNADVATVLHLVNHYPAHDFIIDDLEAGKLFNNVAFPSPDLMLLAGSMGAEVYGEEDEVVVRLLSRDADGKKDRSHGEEQDPEKPGPSEGTGEGTAIPIRMGNGGSLDRPRNPESGDPPSEVDGPRNGVPEQISTKPRPRPRTRSPVDPGDA